MDKTFSYGTRKVMKLIEITFIDVNTDDITYIIDLKVNPLMKQGLIL